MKRSIKQILTILTFFALIIGICPQNTWADEEQEEVPRVVFENEENTGPDLYVTKKVESLDELYEVPQNDEFSFSLKVDGVLAKEMIYRVFNKDNEEIFKYSDGEGVEDKANKITYKADRNGNFTLKGGQTALFADVGVGKHYEITEEPKIGYMQTFPAGGAPATGTIPKEGVGVYFTNGYIPDNEQGTTLLQVQKHITFPSGYELPETPDFTFVLELSGMPHANEEYEIVDMKTGFPAGFKKTDADGKFTLKGGQSATFKDIQTEIDYEVTEESSPNWRIVGQTTVAGATKSPVTLVTFTNANASFGVSKQMENNVACEAEFTFVLTNQVQKPMAEVLYYLYNNSGERLNANATFETDVGGKFKLLPGQTAIFVGIPVDTGYNVYEEVNEGFVQVLPLSVNGYTNKKVGDAVEILPFVNKQVDKKKTLNITKRVVIEDENGLSTNPDFTFILSKRVGATNVPVADAVYGTSVGGVESTYKTNTNGEFKLKRNETAVFKELEADATYQVQEINLPVGYTITEDTKEDVLTDGIYFTFTNVYETKDYQVDLVVHKKNKSKELLPGATFELYKDKELTQKTGTAKTTTATGQVSFDGLELGIYYLVETQSPQGYRLLTNPITIELYNRQGALAVKVNGKAYTGADGSEDIYMVLDPNNNDQVHVTVINREGFSLPFTGSRGVFLAVSVLLIGTALLTRSMFNKRKKSNNRKKE